MNYFLTKNLYLGKIILSHLSDRQLLNFRLINRQANLLVLSDDIWKQKLEHRWGKKLFEFEHGRSSLFKLYYELKNSKIVSKLVPNYIKQGDLFYLHWMYLNNIEFGKPDVKYSKMYGVERVTNWLKSISDPSYDLIFQRMEDFMVDDRYHLCLKDHLGEYICMGILDENNTINPLDDNMSDLCLSLGYFPE